MSMLHPTIIAWAGAIGPVIQESWAQHDFLLGSSTKPKSQLFALWPISFNQIEHATLLIFWLHQATQGSMQAVTQLTEGAAFCSLPSCLAMGSPGSLLATKWKYTLHSHGLSPRGTH